MLFLPRIFARRAWVSGSVQNSKCSSTATALLSLLIFHANRFPCFGHSSLLIQPACLVHLYPLQVNPAKFLCCSTCHTAYNIQQCNFANPVLSALLPCLVNPIAKKRTEGFCQDLPLFLPSPPQLCMVSIKWFESRTQCLDICQCPSAAECQGT